MSWQPRTEDQVLRVNIFPCLGINLHLLSRCVIFVSYSLRGYNLTTGDGILRTEEASCMNNRIINPSIPLGQASINTSWCKTSRLLIVSFNDKLTVAILGFSIPAGIAVGLILYSKRIRQQCFISTINPRGRCFTDGGFKLDY